MNRRRNECACGCGHLTGDHIAEYVHGHVPLKPIAERLAVKLKEAEGGCLEWQGSLTLKGYGRISAGRRGGAILLAHRVAWESANGPIPPGLVICHRCDNPPCCNLQHLFLGTQADNVHDMDRKGRRVTSPPAPCGTRSGYMAHLRKREVTCQPCRDAHQVYLRAYKNARRVAAHPGDAA